MKLLIENWFKLIIVAILTIALLIFSVFLLWIKPSIEQDKIRSQQYENDRQRLLLEQQKTSNLNQRMDCLSKAEKVRDSAIVANTRDYSDMRVPLGEGSYIPTSIKQSINEEFKDNQDYCFRLYPDY